MNRTLSHHTSRVYAPISARRRPTVGDWMLLLYALLMRWLAKRAVQEKIKLLIRLTLGGAAFICVIGIVGGIERGDITLLSGGIWSAVLFAVSVFFLRGLQDLD